MDLISRQAAIDVLSQYPFEKVVNCISILEELPSAQPERNKGEWLEWWPGEAALIMTGEEMLKLQTIFNNNKLAISEVVKRSLEIIS